jgi:hypothetical protein
VPRTTSSFSRELVKLKAIFHLKQQIIQKIIIIIIKLPN